MILFAVRYLAASFTVVQAVRRHPQCNPECCLSVIMMVNDAAEDVVVFDEEQHTEEHIQNEEPNENQAW